MGWQGNMAQVWANWHMDLTASQTDGGPTVNNI